MRFVTLFIVVVAACLAIVKADPPLCIECGLADQGKACTVDKTASWQKINGLSTDFVVLYGNKEDSFDAAFQKQGNPAITLVSQVPSGQTFQASNFVMKVTYSDKTIKYWKVDADQTCQVTWHPASFTYKNVIDVGIIKV